MGRSTAFSRCQGNSVGGKEHHTLQEMKDRAIKLHLNLRLLGFSTIYRAKYTADIVSVVISGFD